MFAAKIEPWKLPVQTVYECHTLGYVNGKLNCFSCVHHQPVIYNIVIRYWDKPFRTHRSITNFIMILAQDQGRYKEENFDQIKPQKDKKKIFPNLKKPPWFSVKNSRIYNNIFTIKQKFNTNDSQS